MPARWIVALLTLLLLLGGPGCPPQPPTPREPLFTIQLQAVGKDPEAVIAAVTSIRGCTPTVARKLVERLGATSLPVRTGLPEETARQGIAALTSAGASALLVPER